MTQKKKVIRPNIIAEKDTTDKAGAAAKHQVAIAIKNTSCERFNNG